MSPADDSSIRCRVALGGIVALVTRRRVLVGSGETGLRNCIGSLRTIGFSLLASALRSFARAIFCNCRIRSLVTPKFFPTSSRVFGLPPSNPNRLKIILRSRSSNTSKSSLSSSRMLLSLNNSNGPSNPAHAVRGPKYVVKKGKTPVWSREDAKTLLDSIPKDSVAGLRDLALIAAMFYSFARVSAVLKLKVDDYYHNGARRRLRLHEKGGKEHEMPVHHLLEQILDEYIAAAGLQS